ncbi:MAG: GNAT family N-acetyltransferase [Cyclobacteriaceae bacterium]|nr:GNAT family N-acetyltransferase [Cyclobacteriaceae bacterium]
MYLRLNAMKYLLKNQQSERLLFRPIQSSDFNEWLQFFIDPEYYKYWVAEKDTPEAECRKWYANQFNRYEKNLGGMNALIEKSTGALVGHAGLLVQVVDGIEELEIAYSLQPHFRGKGFATEAAQTIKEFAFANTLSPSLISIISLTNLPSQRVATKNGMKIEKQTIYKENAVYIFRISDPIIR